jgi:hypothetical protein
MIVYGSVTIYCDSIYIKVKRDIREICRYGQREVVISDELTALGIVWMDRTQT